MKRPGKKVASDRSFVVALSRGLDVLRAFHPNDGLLGNQEIAARTNLPKPTVSRLTYTLTKLGLTLHPFRRFEKVSAAPSAMALGYAAPGESRGPAFVEPYREECMRETGGAVAVGGPRPSQHDLLRPEPQRASTLGVKLDVGSRIPNATTAMGRAYIWALPAEDRASLLRELPRALWQPLVARCATASSAPARTVARTDLRSPQANGRTMCTRSASH
jgi:DNA-binding IclR family transcriptional regulator